MVKKVEEIPEFPPEVIGMLTESLTPTTKNDSG